ncbi:Uncharacterized protein conserved in bacteria [Bordetella ansorpii]|uniref:Uncharacterized protein conserved in bacteria n=1 Tax=Bordetella ansorpii TaxID=288768 RepID=A0A157NRB0_9BORD|nr:Uncharacterized protein conserved in bacteria [Bordetella ansorpii]
MGLLDSLTGSLGAGDENGLLPIVLKQLARYPGGISGLIADFEKGGLGGIVQSWTGAGDNASVSAQQLDGVLDRGVVDAIAQESGQPRDSVLQSLTGLLPNLVDQATPSGTAEDAKGFDVGSLIGALSQLRRG